jgi:hypothetical protein
MGMKEMKTSWLAVMILALGMSACGGSGGADAATTGADAGLGANVDDVAPQYADLTYAAAFDRVHDKAFVNIEGYLQMPEMIYTDGQSGQVYLIERPYQRHGRNIAVSVKTGDCNNCMEGLPKEYKRADFKLKADDGSPIGLNERVRVSGRLGILENSLSKDGLALTMELTSLVKVPEVAIDYKQVEALKVDKTNLMDSTLQYVMSYAEGKLTIPTMIFMDKELTLDMAVGDKNLWVNFEFGTGPNQIEEIPENYGKADFKIHDADGKLINLNRPVKVWGIRSTPGHTSSGFLYVEHIEQGK